MTRIAILETGHPPEALKDSFDDYPARFRALLGENVPTTRFDVQSGHLPSDPSAFQGVIVTGSAAASNPAVDITAMNSANPRPQNEMTPTPRTRIRHLKLPPLSNKPRRS